MLAVDLKDWSSKDYCLCVGNTGNTKAVRRIISEEYPTIMNIQDACHQMHNTCKDICKLPAFKDVGTHRF